MSALRLISNRTSQQALSNSDYTWDYEYYEYGPVSFEGLKAHKCKFSRDIIAAELHVYVFLFFTRD